MNQLNLDLPIESNPELERATDALLAIVESLQTEEKIEAINAIKTRLIVSHG
jgi:hypothetical protein